MGPLQVSDIEIRQVPYRDPAAQALIADLLADLGRRYGGAGDETPVAPADFAPPRGAFLVGYRAGEPVGCGGWRTREDDPAVAEIKRMYVAPERRGQGIARAVLRALEDSARLAGRSRMILETGTLQPEAIALYTRSGYRRIPDFGYYRDEPEVRSFGREL
jgi:GNAT superfamily N-acetyltransferase